MKLLKVNYLYPDYLKQFYLRNKNISLKSYEEQKKQFNYEVFGWADAWTYYLKPCGYETEEIIINAEPLQRQWAKENNFKRYNDLSLDEIALEQIRKFEPEIIWYDSGREELLEKIVSKVKKVKLIIGWTGSPTFKSKSFWSKIDIVFGCAPEAIQTMKAWNYGPKFFHLNHAFDPRVLDRLKNSKGSIDLSFTGQVVMDDDRFHLKRAEMLNELARLTKIKVFSPIKERYSKKSHIKTFVRRRIYDLYTFLRMIGIKNNLLKKIPKIKNVFIWNEKPEYPKRISKHLKKSLQSPLFGLEMFQMTKDSKVTLNIHANSSPRFASNMRLFEAAGVGSCLLTDWKENINELYEDGVEVVTYKSLEECIEKAKWLLEHEGERKKIAIAGQKRTLKEHTFANRAGIIDDIIKKEIKRIKKK